MAEAITFILQHTSKAISDMRNAVLSFLAMILVIAMGQAQHCSLAANSATPHSLGAPGLQPAPQALPCTEVGLAVSDTIYFQNYSTLGGIGISWVKFDSINNLPPGLCWTTNAANNQFNGGQAGVIVISGTPTGPVGQYKLKMKVSMNIGFVLTDRDPEMLWGWKYWIRSRCFNDTCRQLDTTSPYPAYIAYTPCSNAPTATITPAGTVTLCQGDSVTLTAAAGTGYTYHWSTGATGRSIKLAAGGAYTVTVHHGADSAVATPTAVVAVPLPAAAIAPVGPDTICLGDTTVLAATPAGLSYAWSTPGGIGDSYAASSTGTYTVTVTDHNACSAASNTVSVVVRPVLIPVISRAGSDLTVTQGSSYQWYRDAVLLSGESSQSLHIAANGFYTVYVTSTDGCGTYSSPVSVLNVGIAETAGDARIRLYPDPTTDNITLEAPDAVGGSFDIFDATGRSIQQRTVSAEHTAVDLSHHPAGFYTMVLRYGSDTKTFRFALIR